MRSEEEMCELFADIPEALANTVEIAKRCNVTVRLGEYFLPQFPTGDMSTEDYLVKRAKEGLEERLAFLFPDEEERLKTFAGAAHPRLNLYQASFSGADHLIVGGDV